MQRNESLGRPTYHAFSRERPSRAEAEAARRLPRLMMASAGAICSRRDAVKLARNEGLQPRASERPLVGCYAELGRTFGSLTARALLLLILDRFKRFQQTDELARQWLNCVRILDEGPVTLN